MYLIRRVPSARGPTARAVAIAPVLRFVAGVAMALTIGGAGPAFADDYSVAYRVRIRPDAGIAAVSIKVTQPSPLLLELSATLEGEHWFDFEADGELEVSETERFVWRPPARGGELTYSTRIDRLRDDQEYDSRCMPNWMLSRAEDFFPPMAARFESGSESKATLEFDVPPRWTVVTPFEPVGKRFVIEQPHRRLDQPKGWLMAGRLDVLEEVIAGTRVTLAAPRKHDARLRDVLTLLRFTLPVLADIAVEMPARIAIVMADDPMWRGGLAGPDSLYLHADRPLIDADGSSPLLHELVHVMTHARAAPGSDWIVEGLAEYYSLEILRRSGAVSDETHAESLRNMIRRGASVREFSGQSTGAETASAVTLLSRIDRRIRERTEEKSTLDGVVAALVAERTVLDRESLLALIERTSSVDVSEILKSGPRSKPPKP